MKRLIAVLTAAAAAAAIVLLVGGSPTANAGPRQILREAALGRLRPAQIHVRLANGKTTTRILPFVSSATLAAVGLAPEDRGASADRTEGDEHPGSTSASPSTSDLGISPGTLGCSQRNGRGQNEHFDDGGGRSNVRVNQDCSFRRQAEEDIVANPTEPNNLVAGQNDSRVGFNQCGIDWSLDNGQHWGDMLPPFRSRFNAPFTMELGVGGHPNRNTILGGDGTFHTYDAASDPTVAFDSQGRAYFGCVVFDINDDASGLFVTQSPQGARGSFFYNVPSPTGSGTRDFMVVEDNNPAVVHDKEFITADYYPASPNRDNVYVTWTVFKFDPRCVTPDNLGGYCESPIFGSMSTDHGHSWSTPQLISATSDTLCFAGNLFDPTANPHSCNFDQGSDPAVLPDGSVFVTFNNGNTAPGVPNGQQLGVLCHPGGKSENGTAQMCPHPTPVKVGDDIVVGEPQCNFGRGPEECIPGAFIRTNDFPRIVTNTQNGHLYVVWQDYRNKEYDIQESMSTDGGLTWHEIGTVNPDKGLDHYFAAVDQSPRRGDRVAVSYYRTERVPNENSAGVFAPGQPGVDQGNSDYVLAGGTSSQTPYAFKVLSPVFPPPDGIQTGFNGDYSGVIVNKGEDVHPIWSDTRNVDPFAPTNGVVHDEDVFTDNVGLQNGNARRDDNGHVGKGGDRR